MNGKTGYEGLLAVDLSRRMLSEAETEYFLRLAIIESDPVAMENIAVNLRGGDVPYTVGIILACVDQTKMCVTPCLVAFVTLLCDNGGRATLWAHALYKLACEKSKTKAEPLSLTDWSFWFGDHGIPDEAGCKLAWERQKHASSPGSNWLDDPQAWV